MNKFINLQLVVKVCCYKYADQNCGSTQKQAGIIYLQTRVGQNFLLPENVFKKEQLAHIIEIFTSISINLVAISKLNCPKNALFKIPLIFQLKTDVSTRTYILNITL